MGSFSSLGDDVAVQIGKRGTVTEIREMGCREILSFAFLQLGVDMFMFVVSNMEAMYHELFSWSRFFFI